MKAAKKTNGVIAAVLMIVIALLAEAVMSNFVWLAYVAGKDGERDFVPYQSDYINISTINNVVDFECENFRLNSVSFTVASPYEDAADSLLDIDFYVFDENSSYSAVVSRNETVTLGKEARRYKVYLNSYGGAKGVSMVFPEVEDNIVLSDVVINESYSFSFNAVRFGIIAVFLLLINMFKGKTGKQLRDEMTFNNAAMIACSFCCFVSFNFWLFCSSGEDGNYISYPLVGGPEYWQPYVQQFDAFLKGQLHIDVQPSEGLLALDNPYSPDTRQGLEYLYDRAFFDGKYYSYFGIGPILTVYLPFYLITRLLPTDCTVTGIFSLITALFLPWAVVEWAKLRKVNIRPWFAGVCAVGAYFASSVLLIQRGRMPFYYIASIAGMAFVSAFFFFIFKAFNVKKKSGRFILLFLAGLSFGLAFLSRINSVVAPAILVAVFAIVYFIRSIKEKKVGRFFGEMFTLALPVAAAVGFSMYYNYIRFGNVLQFGSDYQLTVLNASLYELSASGIFAAVYHFFIDGFETTKMFPYIGFSTMRFADYGRLVYTDSNFGIFAFPFMLALLLSPVLLKSGRISKSGKTVLSVSLVALLLTAVLDFCMGGVIFRYTADIALVAAIVSAAIILEITFILQENHSASISYAAKKVAAIAAALTAVICLGVSVSINEDLVSYDPDYYCALKDFLVFWN